MSETAIRAAAQAALPSDAALRAVIDAELAPLVKQIDHDGLYPAGAMRALGGAGLFAHHLAAHSPRPSIAAAIPPSPKVRP